MYADCDSGELGEFSAACEKGGPALTGANDCLLLLAVRGDTVGEASQVEDWREGGVPTFRKLTLPQRGNPAQLPFGEIIGPPDLVVSMSEAFISHHSTCWPPI